MTYVRKDLVVKTEVKESNSYCDSLLLHIPQLNLVLVNIYRPPSCPENLFKETMDHVSDFFRNLESQENCANTYLVLGDFNFPFLKFSDSECSTESIRSCVNCSDLSSCSHTSSVKKQAKMLLDFANEFFLDQYIKKPTRNKNILDLCFTNDHFLIHNYQVIVNSQLSDHFTICLNLNYEKLKKPEKKVKSNMYQTTIPEYDLKAGDEEDWLRLNLLLNKINWETIFQNLSTEECLISFLKVLEENIALVFSKRPEYQDPVETTSNFSSKNKIPRKIRNLMRNKSKLSKTLLKIKSVSRYLKLKGKLELIENELKSLYTQRRLGQEKKAIERMKKDPKSFFNYAKKFSKTNTDIGPFFDKDGNPVLEPKTIVEMLQQQYESAFSSPKKDMIVDSPEDQ